MKRILFLLLMLASALGTGVPGHAAPPLSIGFVAGPQGLVRDAVQADALADRLSAQLQQPLRVRLFDGEDQLYQWLTRYREVDCGWLSAAFLQGVPAGELQALAAAEGPSGRRLAGLFVARQGTAADRLQQLHAALLAMNGSLPEDPRLAGLDLARFIPAAETAIAPPRREAVPAATVASSPPAVPADLPPATPAAQPAAVPTDSPAAAGAAAAREGAGAAEPVSLEADTLDYDGATGVFHAAGSVLLRQGAATLASDELLWQATTRDAVASGSVHLAEPGAELDGSSLTGSFATGRGVARDARVFLQERNFHLAGTEIERLGEATYRVSGGSFTTCDGEQPDWRFTADQVDVTLGDYAAARHVWFEVGDQPLLYLPYLLFPVKSERESGFLLPRVGYSSRKGALLSLAWYEVIDRHLDATVYVDYLSRLGLGKGLEYRYALGGGNQGEALYYHVGGFSDTPDSYALTWRHGGTLPGGVRLTADVEYVDRIEFFEDFGETADEYNRDQTVSTVMLQRNWEKLNLTGYARYIKALENDNDATLQRLPELGLDVPLFLLDGAAPLYARTELRAASFRRDAGEEGERLSLRQGLGLALKPGSWLEFRPEVAVYGRAYHADAGDESALVAEYAATLSTRLQRVYAFERWGFDRLRHSIEPEIRYVYVPAHDQDDLPVFDLHDRIGPRNLVEYALINRLTARSSGADGAPSYRELLNLRLSQAYDIRTERDDTLDDPEPFSDLRTELAFSPADGYALEVDALIRVHDEPAFTRVNASLGSSDGHGNGAALRYSYRSAESGFGATDYLALQVDTALLAPVYLNLQERYDFLEGEALESVVNLEYRAQCWSLFLTFRDRPESEEVLVGFALSGLGRVGGFGSSLSPLNN